MKLLYFFVTKDKSIRKFSLSNYLLDKKISVYRWGDGETLLLLGKDTYFQSSSVSLSILAIKFLFRIRNKNNHILLFPSIFKMKYNKHFTSTNKLLHILLFFGFKNLYSDALELRDNRSLRLNIIKKFIEYKKCKAIILSNKWSIQLLEMKQIISPLTTLIQVESNNINTKFNIEVDGPLFIAAGPVVKWRSLFFHEKIVFDIGHGLDYYLNE